MRNKFRNFNLAIGGTCVDLYALAKELFVKYGWTFCGTIVPFHL